MSDEIRTEKRGGDENPVVVNVCNDCRAWEHVGKPLRHSKRCATPRAQPDFDPNRCTTKGDRKTLSHVRDIERAAKAGEIATTGLSEDEIVGAVNAGVISMSDAMNRDC